MMIFIADDSDLMRERLTALLTEIEGVEVIGQARTVADAIEGIRALSPDFVILDIQMPGGSGIDVLKAVKQYAHPPLVMMFTNHAQPQYRDKCIEWGADFFLDKSREFESLAPICESLIKHNVAKAGPAGDAA